MLDYELFLEGTDLLEAVELEADLKRFIKDEIINAKTVIVINKNKLNDKEYVQSLIDKINNRERYPMTSAQLVTMIMDILSAATVAIAVSGTIGQIIFLINGLFALVKLGTYRSMDKTQKLNMIKQIDKLIKKSEKESDPNIKKGVEKLKQNKKLIEDSME